MCKTDESMFDGLSEKEIEEIKQLLGIGKKKIRRSPGNAQAPRVADNTRIMKVPVEIMVGIGETKKPVKEIFKSFKSIERPEKILTDPVDMLDIIIEIGKAVKPVGEVLELGEGSIIELDRKADDPVDIYINDIWAAKGRIVVIEENFGVRIIDDISISYESEILRLSGESIIELNRNAGDPIDMYVNNILFAKGSVVVIEENFGVKIIEVL